MTNQNKTSTARARQDGAYEAWQDAEAALEDLRAARAPSVLLSETEAWRDLCKQAYETAIAAV